MVKVFSVAHALSFLLAIASVGSTSSGTVNIHLDAPMQGLWGRYVVTHGESKRIGWLRPKPGQTLFLIPAPLDGTVRGVVYAPGCAVKTFAIAVNSSQSNDYNFRCDAIPQAELLGSVTSLANRFDHPVRVEAKYFLGLGDGMPVEIPLGSSTAFDDQNQFRLSVPVLSEGEVRLFVRDQVTGQIVDELRPASENLHWQPTIRSVMAFVFATDSCAHDEFGFSFRSDKAGHCIQ